jgi:hypothetical protein
MTKISRSHKHLLLLALCALFLFIGAFTVKAATYYVATTGLDSNPGTSSSRFGTIQKCIDVMVAGDTCVVGSGTYTATVGYPIVAYVRPTNASGTANSPITIRSEKHLGAQITVPGIENQVNAGIYITQSYYIIDGFDISGGTSGTTGKVSHAGISLPAGTTGHIIRNNAIHGIARTLCYDVTYGNAGIFTSADNVTITNNLIYGIGRRRQGESGCTTNIYHHDHGIYLDGGANPVIRNNAFYDTNRGYPLHVWGGTVTNLSVYNNTFADGAPTGSPSGHILLGNTIHTANIKNNISHNPVAGMVTCYSLSASNVLVDHNLSSTAVNTGTCTGITYTNNRTSTSPGFIDATSHNYALAVQSVAIDTGTNVGLSFAGAAPDIGAYEFNGNLTLAPPRNLQVR